MRVHVLTYIYIYIECKRMRKKKNSPFLVKFSVARRKLRRSCFRARDFSENEANEAWLRMHAWLYELSEHPVTGILFLEWTLFSRDLSSTDKFITKAIKIVKREMAKRVHQIFPSTFSRSSSPSRLMRKLITHLKITHFHFFPFFFFFFNITFKVFCNTSTNNYFEFSNIFQFGARTSVISTNWNIFVK